MASKAGRVQLKDIKVGRTFWRVIAGVVHYPVGGMAPAYSWAHRPERIEIIERPFRSLLDTGEDLMRLVEDWSFLGRLYYNLPGESGRNHDMWFDCSAWGIVTDVTKGQFGHCFLFTTKAAAERYYTRMNRTDTKHSFEHPRQWTKHNLIKRAVVRPNGTKCKMGDVPSFGHTLHGPWLYTRPTERLVCGVVVDHDTPKETVDYLVEQGRKEIGTMYPTEVKAVVFPKGYAVTDATAHVILDESHDLEEREALREYIMDDSVRDLYPDRMKKLEITELSMFSDTHFSETSKVKSEKVAMRMKEVMLNDNTSLKVVVGDGIAPTRVETVPKQES